jgi:hypothetical protein
MLLLTSLKEILKCHLGVTLCG